MVGQDLFLRARHAVWVELVACRKHNNDQQLCLNSRPRSSVYFQIAVQVEDS